MHLLHAGSNKDRLQEFADRFVAHESSLTLVLTAQTAHLGASTRDDIARLQRDLQPVISLARFIVGIMDSDEEVATQFVRTNGGEQRVQSVSAFRLVSSPHCFLNALPYRMIDSLGPLRRSSASH